MNTRLRGAMEAEAETFYDPEEEENFAAPIFPIKAPRKEYLPSKGYR